MIGGVKVHVRTEPLELAGRVIRAFEHGHAVNRHGDRYRRTVELGAACLGERKAVLTSIRHGHRLRKRAVFAQIHSHRTSRCIRTAGRYVASVPL